MYYVHFKQGVQATQCLKIAIKSRIQYCEHVYILSGQKFIKNAILKTY